MYDMNTGTPSGPNADDALALQALYGARQIDPYAGHTENNTFSTAVPLVFLEASNLPPGFPATVGGGPSSNSDSNNPWVVNGDIASLTDQDIYSVTVAADSVGPMAVVVRTVGISLLTPSVTVYDALGNTVASAVATDPLRNDLTLTIPAPTPGSQYFVKIASGQANAFGIGSYRLTAGMPALAQLGAYPPAGVGLIASSPGNNSIDNPMNLKPQTPGTDARWQHVVPGGLTSLDDTEFYRVRNDAHTSQALIATVWGAQPGGLSPRVQVFDNHGNVVAAQVLAQDASADTIQVPSAAPNTNYSLEVSPADPTSAHAVGNFTLAIDLRPAPITVDSITSGVITTAAAAGQDFHMMTVASTEDFHFDLSGTSADGTIATAVRMTIYDSNNKPVYTLRAQAGPGSSFGNIMLAPGTYTMRFVAATRTGAPLPKFSYVLRGTVRTDPIGPGPTDPTLTPTGPGGTPDPFLITPPPDPVPAYFYLTAIDPYCNPWWQ
jgi:hypothetical protein